MKYLPRLCCPLVLLVLSCSDEDSRPPSAPEQLIAKPISRTQIQLTWTDVSIDETGFVIERRSGSQFTEIARASVNVFNYLDENLTPETFYEYRVASFNSTGKSVTYSNIASGKTLDLIVPLQVTTEISQIGMASALGLVGFNADVYPEVSDLGFVWSTLTGPTTELETKTQNFFGAGNSFIAVIGVLQPTQQYYVRAYATNALGTVYGNEVSFTTSNTPLFRPGNGIVDIEGNSYKTIVIGTQEWMAENLRTATFSNGETIANVTDGEKWDLLTTPAWCHYDNDSQYDNLQGKMYNWYAASNPRNVCPNGWHLPKSSEWDQLSDYLGGGFIAGVRLKSPLPTWAATPDISTNESGFSAVHSGWCHTCNGLYAVATWWTSTLENSSSAYVLNVWAGSGGILSLGIPLERGVCVRCIKN